jgi:hypothetical protein
MKKLIVYMIQPLLSINFYIRSYYKFIQDFRLFRKSNTGTTPIKWRNRKPCLYDATSYTGFDRHYVYHTAWAARKLQRINPTVHFDIGSSIYFSAIASAYTPIRFFDYRPAALQLSQLSCEHANLSQLAFPDNTVESISCMHVIEHIGLGRYGDPVDPQGDIQAVKELKRVVALNGNLLIVVPVGKPMIQYNAHRIYSYQSIIDLFDGFELVEFALIEEEGHGGLLTDGAKELVRNENYGCGCFWFRKVKAK